MYAPVELTRPTNNVVAVEPANSGPYIAQTGTGKGAGDAAAPLANAASSVAAPLVQSDPALAPGLVGGVQMQAAESPELVRYQIQMLELYKSAVLDPLFTLADKRQQVPDLLRQQIADLVDQYAQLLPKLNEKLAKTTARASAMQALPINPSMPTVDQFTSTSRACDNLNNLEVQLQNTKKLSLLAQDPVVKARQLVADLQGISGKMYSQLEVKLALELADQASQEVPKNLRNQAMAAHIQSLPLLESLANSAPINPEALQQFKKDYLNLVRQTLGNAESAPTLIGLEEYFSQGLTALGDSPAASTVEGLSQELAQCKRMNSITLKLLQLLASHVTEEENLPLLSGLQEDLSLNTQTSPQLHALLTQHPKRLVKALAPLGLGQTSAEFSTEVGKLVSETPDLHALAQRYPKVLTAPKLLETEMHKDSAFKAAELGSLDTLHILLDKGVDLLVRNADGNGLLHVAAAKGQVQVATYLTQVQGLPDDLALTQGLRELTYIAKYRSLPQLTSYLRRSPVLLASAQAKITAMALARDCAKLGKSNQARHLVTAFDLDVEQPDGNSLNRTKFHKASIEGNIEEMRILKTLGANIHAVDEESNSAFHLAANFANPNTLLVFHHWFGMHIGFGIHNINRKGFDGRNPFLGATAWGKTDNMHTLWQMGADIHAVDNQLSNALYLAARFATPETIMALVNKYGFKDLEQRGFNGRTPLLGATESGNIPTMCTLIELGADAHAVDDQSHGALHIAACFANPETLQVLHTQFGLKNMEVRGVKGFTPYLQAAARGNLPNLRALEPMGADIHAQDNQGRNALAIAKQRHNIPEVIEYLQSIGVTSTR